MFLYTLVKTACLAKIWILSYGLKFAQTGSKIGPKSVFMDVNGYVVYILGTEVCVPLAFGEIHMSGKTAVLEFLEF